mgnify:CR=1 FL=1|jgi:Glycosyltransferases involved in cell wall biogenesis
MSDFLPKLSVITVVYNNARDIERTILSVVNQTYPNIEYLVIDGGSADGTVGIIERYASRITKWVSEPDQGIYDAMNKGLAMASGDYVLFMNSGDEIYAADTVERVFASFPGADIYYGETEVYNESWQPIGLRRHAAPERFNWKSFRYGMNVSHQAIYVRRTIAEAYDTRYQLSADIDWVIRAAKRATKIWNTKLLVAKYLAGGISKRRHWKSLRERFQILSKHYGILPNLFNHTVIVCNLALHYMRHKRTNN